MRTKTLLATIVLGAGCVGLMQAQVFSSNAVGYVNKTLLPGFNSIANPLENADGSNLETLFPADLPLGSRVWFMKADGSFDFSEWSDPFGLGAAWSQPLNSPPGNGMLVDLAGDENFTITFVGEVLQGDLVNPIPAGFSYRASQVPQALTLDVTDEGGNFPAAIGDFVYTFGNTTGWKAISYDDPFGIGADWSEPVNLEVGEGFLVNTAEAKNWTRTFSVND